jgi:hypothetical protein
MSRKNARNKLRWTQEDIELLKLHYPKTPLKKISALLKRGEEGIKSAAAKYGIERHRRKGTLFYSNGKPKYRVLKNGCWQWIAGVNKKGYPLARGKDTTLAYRQIYIDANGPISDGFDVDHTCRYRRCVNAEHLEAVTHQENIQRNSRTKLTKTKAEKIRAEPSSVTFGQLAEKYGVSYNAAYFARTGRSWL